MFTSQAQCLQTCDAPTRILLVTERSIKVAQVMFMEGTRHSGMVMLLTGSWSLVLPWDLAMRRNAVLGNIRRWA